jgi:hypothetical protein
MNERQQIEQVNWLSAKLSVQRDKLSSFLLRLKGIAVRVTSGLSLNKKFMRLMDQVAADREKEFDIIREIEDVERRHHELRQHNMLQRIAHEAEKKRKRSLKKENEDYRENEEDKEEDEEGFSLMELLAMLYLFSSQLNPFSGSKSSKQEPSVE